MAAAGLFAATATTASATPSKTSKCSNCHSGAGATVTATLLSTSATGATYNLSAPGANAIAVFNGSTKVGSTIGAVSGQVTLPFGATYTIYGVTGPTETDGIGSTTVSPTAPQPAPDTTAPTTTSNAKASYLSSALITMSAVDNAGGSGVAHTYYVLDALPQAEGLTVSTSVIGSHTLSFWSVDVAGNIETHNVVTFDITAPVPVPDTTAPTTTSNAKTSYLNSALITLSAVDNAGGSGVAHTYYILDALPQAEGLTVSTSAVGSHSIEFWSVDVAGNIETHNVVTFEVTAPVPDTTAPVTTSNVKASYSGSALITLTAVDSAGGSGVAHTYYILDGAPQAEGTAVSTSVLGSHALSFWSVDVAGNVEVATNVSFEVTAVPVPTTQTCTIDSMRASRSHGHRIMRLTGTITPGQVGDHAMLYVKKPGSHHWIRVAMVTARSLNSTGGAVWSYTYTMNVRGTYHFQVRPVVAPVTTNNHVERD
jgi:hypothetical protein